jgi:hypothetical protein
MTIIFNISTFTLRLEKHQQGFCIKDFVQAKASTLNKSLSAIFEIPSWLRHKATSYG